MAKAVLCQQSTFDKTAFVVKTVYPDGTDMTKVGSPTTGQLLIPVAGDWWSINDTVSPDTICTGLAVILATITTVNWTQVKAAIN